MAAIELRTYLLAVYRVRDARVGAMDNSQNVAFFRVRNPRMGSLHSIEASAGAGWNGPIYRRAFFTTVAASAITELLQKIRSRSMRNGSFTEVLKLSMVIRNTALGRPWHMRYEYTAPKYSY